MSYFVPDDFEDATVSASPALETLMPASYAQLDDRSVFLRSTGIGTQVLTWHWGGGSNRYIDSFLMAQHTGYGGSYRLELFSARDSATSRVYDSGTNVIISALVVSESFAWGLAKFGLPLDDQLADEATLAHFFTGVQCASGKLTLTNCQSLYWQIGRIVMGRRVESAFGPEVGMTFGYVDNVEHSRMRGATLRSRAGYRWPELSANIFTATDAQRAAWQDFKAKVTNRTCGVSIFPGVGGRQERDHVAVMVPETNTPNRWDIGFNNSPLRMIGI